MYQKQPGIAAYSTKSPAISLSFCVRDYARLLRIAYLMRHGHYITKKEKCTYIFLTQYLQN
jgi:hypothetical protein